jgi:hypothetical protein
MSKNTPKTSHNNSLNHTQNQLQTEGTEEIKIWVSLKREKIYSSSSTFSSSKLVDSTDVLGKRNPADVSDIIALFQVAEEAEENERKKREEQLEKELEEREDAKLFAALIANCKKARINRVQRKTSKKRVPASGVKQIKTKS